MSITEFRRIRELFDQLADLPAAQRRPFLQARADVADSTCRQLLELLAEDEELADKTARRAYALHRPARDWIGSRIGDFEIVREIGGGGMGRVHLARRIEGGITQQVAIKIIHAWRSDGDGLARFRLEGQVLALLRHPHIAMLHGIGELADGTPYVVMEYVDGLPLLDYVRKHALGLRARLAIFLQICDAVSYAHRSLVVHRDLKPGNILVDGDGSPKLLDFGIAKPLVDRLGEIDVEQTQATSRYFSLRNAAPEQLRGDTITVACDVYGLGTLLYQLLCDFPAHDLEGVTAGEAERRILYDDPLPPSRRAAAHGAEAPPWTGDLAGDLDAISARTLRKEAERRYRSVDELAADLRRYLDGYPVEARQGSGWYHLKRFISRNRFAVLLSATFFLLLSASGALLLRQFLISRSEYQRAERVTDTLLSALESVDPANAKSKELSAREVVEQVGKFALAALSEQDATRARLTTTLARVNLRLGLPAEAAALLTRSDAGIEAAAPEVRAAREIIRAEALRNLSDFAGARQSLDTARRLVREPAQRAELDVAQATLLRSQGKHNEAITILLAVTGPQSGASQETGFAARRELADAYLTKDQREAAWNTAAAVLEDQRKVHTGAHPELLTTLIYVIDIAFYVERKAEAAALAEEAMTMAQQLYGEETLPYANTLTEYAAAMAMQDRLDEAKKYSAQSLEISRRLLGEDAAALSGAHFNLANLYSRTDDEAKAFEHYREAVRIGEKHFSDTSGALYLFRTLLAYSLLHEGDYAQALEMIDRALGMSSRHPEIDDPDVDVFANLIRACIVQSQSRNERDRLALADALQKAQTGAIDASTKEFVGLLTPTAQKLLSTQ
jgi:serine/threonine-protein kinase